MSLFRKIQLMITFLVVVMFLGIFIISINQARNYYATQLKNNAENTAITLGLNLAPLLKQNNLHRVKSMIQPLLTHGDFDSISVFDVNGSLLASQTQTAKPSQAPHWFSQWLTLPPHDVKSTISLQHQALGTIQIKSSVENTYRDLWELTVNLFWWFSILALLAIAFSYSAMKWILLPLKKLIAQAKSISNKEFRMEMELPKSHELRQLSEAMNHMVVKLQEVFNEQLNLTEKFRSQAYLDPLTNLGNRKFFNQKVKFLLASKEDFFEGFLLLIEVKDLKNFNDRYGFQKGDELIKTISFVLEQQLPNKKLYLLARIAGATFASVVTDVEEKGLSNIVSNVLHSLRQHLNSFEISTNINIGAVAYQQSMTLSQILSGADHALRQAQSKGAFTYCVNDVNALEDQYPATQWNNILLEALNNNSLIYYAQNVIVQNGDPYHQEVYIKILDQGNSLINASTFFPEAERFGFAIEFDQTVIKHIIMQVKRLNPERPYAINIASASLYDKGFIEWLYQELGSLQHSKRQFLQFEISESVIFNDLMYCETLFRKWKTMGIKLGIDKVGANFYPIHYMYRLNISYLKIDGSYTNGIEQDKDKQFFIYHLCQAANTLGVDVIATNVETAIQWQVLQEAQVKLGQGYYFEAPHLLEHIKPILMAAS